MFNQEDALDKTKQAFSEWRDNRANRGPIPQYLWDMVIPLLSKYPKSMIMRALNLNSSQLKRNASPANITFVEAIAADTADNTSDERVSPSIEAAKCVCDIELKRACGAVLKINALPISVVTTLIPSFLGE